MSGTTLKLGDNLSAGNGTLTSNPSGLTNSELLSTTTVLHLLDNVTLTFNGVNHFKALEHNGYTLTLDGGEYDSLKLIDPLTLNAVTLHTHDASLYLQ